MVISAYEAVKALPSQELGRGPASFVSECAPCALGAWTRANSFPVVLEDSYHNYSPAQEYFGLDRTDLIWQMNDAISEDKETPHERWKRMVAWLEVKGL